MKGWGKNVLADETLSLEDLADRLGIFYDQYSK
jgi:hypothetical protein